MAKLIGRPRSARERPAPAGEAAAAATPSPPTEPLPAGIRACRAAYDRWARLASGRVGVPLMLAWAFAEATVWPIIPDFLLVPLAAVAGRRLPRLLLAAIGGMALGGAVTYLFAWFAPEPARTLLLQLPTVNERQLAFTHDRLARDGVSAFVAQPWSGVSYKVWGVVAADNGIPPWSAIPVFVLARAFRLALTGTVAWLVGRRFQPWLRDRSLAVALIYLVLFLAGWRQVAR